MGAVEERTKVTLRLQRLSTRHTCCIVVVLACVCKKQVGTISKNCANMNVSCDYSHGPRQSLPRLTIASFHKLQLQRLSRSFLHTFATLAMVAPNSGIWVSVRGRRQSRMPMFSSLPLFLLVLLLVFAESSYAIKFTLPAYRYPPAKCIWNNVHTNQLVIVTANVGPGANQRVDIEIVDSSSQKNVYLSKKGIKGETRLAVTAHAEGEVGVCFKNHLEGGMCYFSLIVLK